MGNDLKIDFGSAEQQVEVAKSSIILLVMTGIVNEFHSYDRISFSCWPRNISRAIPFQDALFFNVPDFLPML
jgi:hypothetical protein